MNKVQILELGLAAKEGTSMSVFNPLNGRRLTIDGSEPLDIDYENDPTLMLVYAGDDISDGPIEWNSDFEDHYQNYGFENIEDESELEKALNKIDDSCAYILLKVSHSGILPGDYGRMLFVLKVENISL